MEIAIQVNSMQCVSHSLLAVYGNIVSKLPQRLRNENHRKIWKMKVLVGSVVRSNSIQSINIQRTNKIDSIGVATVTKSGI